MGGLTGSPRLRIVALVLGSLAALAMIIVGCSSVTEGTPTVNAADAPVYRASVSASMEESAASLQLPGVQATGVDDDPGGPLVVRGAELEQRGRHHRGQRLREGLQRERRRRCRRSGTGRRRPQPQRRRGGPEHQRPAVAGAQGRPQRLGRRRAGGGDRHRGQLRTRRIQRRGEQAERRQDHTHWTYATPHIDEPGAPGNEQEQRESASRLQALKEQAATERTTEVADIRRQADEEIARARREATEAAEREHAARPAPVADRPAVVSLEQLTTAMQSIESAQTLTDALDSLLRAAGAVASRAVVFLVNGDRLRSWRTVGFPQLESQPFDASIAGTGMLAKAAQTGDPIASGAGQPAPTFAAMPADASALAVPITVDGRAVGVLYADTANATGTVPSPAWRDIVATLARHASAVVALVTALRTAQALGVPRSGNGEPDEQGARRYARLLVSEIKLYNEAAVRTGRERRDLLSRLRPEIDRARRLYEERVPPVVGARGQYFQQELVQTLADGDPALLGNA